MLTLEQDKALKILNQKIVNKDPVTVLNGYAGCGKTFTISYLIEALGYPEDAVQFCAFTGAATKVMLDNGMNAQTIHSLIFKPVIHRGVLIGFTKKGREELAHIKLLVVDEYSMVSQELLNHLLSYNIPILLVGDPAQLKPPGGEYNDYIYKYDAILTEVHRQALDSPVLWAATKVRQKESLLEGVYGNNELLVGRRIKLDKGWLRKDVQIICGTNNTRQIFNTQIAGDPKASMGDKIIFLQNNLELNVVNGSLGVLDSVVKGLRYDILDVTMDDGIKLSGYNASYQNILKNRPKHVKNAYDLAYAITCHKAQGKTITDPLLIIDESHIFPNEEVSWLYTALTRATGEKPVALMR